MSLSSMQLLRYEEGHLIFLTSGKVEVNMMHQILFLYIYEYDLGLKGLSTGKPNCNF